MGLYFGNPTVRRSRCRPHDDRRHRRGLRGAHGRGPRERRSAADPRVRWRRTTETWARVRTSTAAAPRCDHAVMTTTPRAHDDLEAILAQVDGRRRRDERTRSAPRSTRPSRGTTRRVNARRSTSSTRRRRPRSGTAAPTSTGRSTVDPERDGGRAVAQRPPDAVRARARSTNRARPCALGRAGDHPLRDGERGPSRQPVPARRAGRAHLHRPHRRDRALDRRQVLRLDAGGRRGAPRRGVRPLPRREARDALPDERAPRRAHRRRALRLPLGHHVPRHADPDRGPGPGRVRLDLQDQLRTVAASAHPLRHERRGTSCGVRCAVVAGGVRAAVGSRSCANGRSSSTRDRCACATGSCTRRCGSGSVSPRARSSPTSSARTATRRSSSSACCSRRSCRTARSSACSTPAHRGSGTGSREMGVLEYEDYVDTSIEYDGAERHRAGAGRRAAGVS